ncbi:unnamed protein product [Trichogramma brassicae]|uniref:Uncharacterized protein n=1 Tax=Trichogramma brassicae TaxID=86971 RepID=A0A6H5IC66_9HYME|nr:unnamed protein product [Trichogramma brassicae]
MPAMCDHAADGSEKGNTTIDDGIVQDRRPLPLCVHADKCDTRSACNIYYTFVHRVFEKIRVPEQIRALGPHNSLIGDPDVIQRVNNIILVSRPSSSPLEWRTVKCLTNKVQKTAIFLFRFGLTASRKSRPRATARTASSRLSLPRHSTNAVRRHNQLGISSSISPARHTRAAPDSPDIAIFRPSHTRASLVRHLLRGKKGRRSQPSLLLHHLTGPSPTRVASARWWERRLHAAHIVPLSQQTAAFTTSYSARRTSSRATAATSHSVFLPLGATVAAAPAEGSVPQRNKFGVPRIDAGFGVRRLKKFSVSCVNFAVQTLVSQIVQWTKTFFSVASVRAYEPAELTSFANL